MYLSNIIIMRKVLFNKTDSNQIFHNSENKILQDQPMPNKNAFSQKYVFYLP